LLRTKSQHAATTRAVTLASRLDEDWLTIRWRTDGDLFSRFMNISTGAINGNASGPLMTKASQIYLKATAVHSRSLRLLKGPSDILYQ
jgi:hypothetical protein